MRASQVIVSNFSNFDIENRIDIEDLESLTSKILRELIPPAGDRIKFAKVLEKLDCVKSISSEKSFSSAPARFEVAQISNINGDKELESFEIPIYHEENELILSLFI